MKNKIQFILLIPLLLLLLNTSYGQKYKTAEVNKTMCRTWRLYSFNPDSTGPYFKFDYAYVMVIDILPEGKANLHYPDTLLHGSWKWDEPNQLITISTTPNIDEKPSIFKILEMDKKKCVLEVPGQSGKGSNIYLREGAK